MGYAIFAARKLQLTSRISNLNFRIMALSQQQQSLASVSSMLQQGFAQMGMSLGGGFNNTLFGNNMFGVMCGGMGGSMFGSLLGGGMNGFNNCLLPGIFSTMSGYRDTMMMQGQYLNALSQSIMKPVAMQENQIEQERKRLETQLKAADTELKQVEEAENKQIEKSAPKFA